VFFVWGSRLWKIDHKTGAGIRRVLAPAPIGANSLAGVAANSDGEPYLAAVLPDLPATTLNASDLTTGTAIATGVPAYGRAVAVSPDGKDFYAPRFTALQTYIYHSNNGSLGPFTLADSMGIGTSVETMAFSPKTGDLWFAADRRSTSAWSANTFYAYRPSTKAIVDSFKVDTTGALAWKPADLLPRGMAFSPTGDTLYIAHFDGATIPAVARYIWTLSVSVERTSNVIPDGYKLDQNFPNPFNPTTEIRFSTVKDGYVMLKVYDILGREIRNLVDETLPAGDYNVKFDASDLTSGTYVYVLTAGDVRLTKKMMLAK